MILHATSHLTDNIHLSDADKQISDIHNSSLRPSAEYLMQNAFPVNKCSDNPKRNKYHSPFLSLYEKRDLPHLSCLTSPSAFLCAQGSFRPQLEQRERGTNACWRVQDQLSGCQTSMALFCTTEKQRGCFREHSR